MTKMQIHACILLIVQIIFAWANHASWNVQCSRFWRKSKNKLHVMWMFEKVCHHLEQRTTYHGPIKAWSEKLKTTNILSSSRASCFICPGTHGTGFLAVSWLPRTQCCNVAKQNASTTSFRLHDLFTNEAFVLLFDAFKQASARTRRVATKYRSRLSVELC